MGSSDVTSATDDIWAAVEMCKWAQSIKLAECVTRVLCIRELPSLNPTRGTTAVAGFYMPLPRPFTKCFSFHALASSQFSASHHRQTCVVKQTTDKQNPYVKMHCFVSWLCTPHDSNRTAKTHLWSGVCTLSGCPVSMKPCAILLVFAAVACDV